MSISFGILLLLGFCYLLKMKFLKTF
ncbi:GlyGly-CTERM sorting domain-containing protein [Candidatus Parvarchaeota archaeon]|nr:GlyGly-CTERM sorting domain-containing protein [Candidatus Parvarchaeota archaeon]